MASQRYALKGRCYRIWFTEDDLSQKGMTTLTNDDLIDLLSGEERPFNSLLKDKYLNEQTGKALLTRIPPGWVNSAAITEYRDCRGQRDDACRRSLAHNRPGLR